MNILNGLPKEQQEKEFVLWALNFIQTNGLETFLSLMRNKIKIPIKLPIEALWRAWEVQEEPKYQHLSNKAKAILAEAGIMKKRLVFEHWNKIMNGYKSAIIANNMGTQTAAQHLQIDYVAIGTRDCKASGVEPTVLDAQLGKEFYRAVPDEIYESSGSLIVILYLNATQANPTNTTVLSASSNTVFTVQIGQGANYVANDWIRVFTSTWEYATVQSVAGDVITLKSPGLTITPTSGMLVERGFGEVMLFCGQATGAANSGTPVNHAPLDFFKNITTSILVEVHLNYVTAA